MVGIVLIFVCCGDFDFFTVGVCDEIWSARYSQELDVSRHMPLIHVESWAPQPLGSTRRSIPTLSGPWTSSALHETVWYLLGLRILFGFLSSRENSSNLCSWGREAALPLWWSWASM